MKMETPIAVPPRCRRFGAAALRAALSACAFLFAVLAVQFVAPVNDAAAQTNCLPKQERNPDGVCQYRLGASLGAHHTFSGPQSSVTIDANGAIHISHARKMVFETTIYVLKSDNPARSIPATLFFSGISEAICDASNYFQLRRSSTAPANSNHYIHANYYRYTNICGQNPDRPAGEHTMRVEYVLGGNTITVTRQIVIGSDRQSECENPSSGASQINPIGGTWNAASTSCMFPTERFYNTDALAPPFCNSYANCDAYYKKLRENKCPAPLIHKSGYSNVYDEANADVDFSCVCPDTGRAPVGGVCKSLAELAREELAKPPGSPGSTAEVVNLLNEGLDPNATVTLALPLLFAAGRLGHADIVSVLVTFGVNASVIINNRYFPEYMSENGLPGGAPPATGKGVLPWRDAAEVVIHFGEALKVFALTSTVGTAYDWANTQGQFLPLDYLHRRYTRFDSVKNDPVSLAAVETMAGYMLDQGSPCNVDYIDHPICTSRPTCTETGGVLYSCSECAGSPHLSVDGAACVAVGACRSYASANAAIWPDPQCECDNGAANAAGECPSLLDKNLVAEVEKTEPKPVLSSVRALLEAGADPDWLGTEGVPLLFAAGRRGHADIVSVLVTFGVNASVAINDGNQYFPEYMSENGLDGAAPAATGKGVIPWRDAAEVVIHFGEALKVFALTSTVGAAYDWANTQGKFLPLDYLHHRYTKFDSVKNDPVSLAVVETMAGYMLDQGSPCNAAYIDHPICTSRPECPTTGGTTLTLYSCAECAGYPHLSVDGAACVAVGACRPYASANAASWPDPQCECDNGAANAAGECPDLLDAELVAEVEKTEPKPVLSSVRALLEAGADPDVLVTEDIPLLFAAGRRGHAEIVSVLVTFGVNASVVINGATFPEYMSANGYNFATGETTIPWSDAASVVIYFGEALKVFALTSASGTASFDWAGDKGGNWPVEHLRSRYDNGHNKPEFRAVMEVIGGYMLDQGSVCPGQWANHPVCASRPECPTTDGPVYSCSECGGYPNRTLDGASCVVQCPAPHTIVNEAAWPSAQCECEHGSINASGECPAVVDAALAAEIQKQSPDLSRVRALLGAGQDASPNSAGDDGVPLLIVAATLGHAKIVSVLVTAGANVNALDSTFVNLDVVQHAATPLDDRAKGPRALRASVLYHFGGGLDVRNATFRDAKFDWNRADKDGFRALDILHLAAGTLKITLAGEDRAIIDEMAEYMLARGANCSGKTSASDRMQGVCVGGAQVSLARSALFAELEKAPGEASVAEFRRLLGEEGGHPNIENPARTPLLIFAARMGHAEIVSVLVTAGANVNATDPNFFNLDAAQHAATPLSDPAAGPRALRASVLYYFIGGLDVRNAAFADADFDWNHADNNGNRALDILRLATGASKINLPGEDEHIIYNMAERMINRGARCGSGQVHAACLGRPALLFVEAARDPNASAARVRAAARAAIDSGVNLDGDIVLDSHILALAADAGNAAAVSILLTLGLNPDGRLANDNGVLHIVGRKSGANAALQLRILRHFIGGLEVAGKTDLFNNGNGWNRDSSAAGVGLPLDELHKSGSGVASGNHVRREIQALFYERGARCALEEDKTYCQLPEQVAPIPADAPQTGGVLTVTARDFGGAVFDFQLPDEDTLAMLEARGWGMALADGPPARAVLSRTRSSAAALPTVAVTMVNGADAVRRIDLISQADLSPLFVTVVGSGAVAILADGRPIERGQGVAPNQNVEIVATPDNEAHHVSGWSGPCAAAPKGADGGERVCEFVSDGEGNRVTVTFVPGRLALHVPVTGNLQDGVHGNYAGTGTNAMRYFCGVFGGGIGADPNFPALLYCEVFGFGVNACDGGHYPSIARRCGSTDFRHIRDCNLENKPAVNRDACGEPCDAAAGMAARGDECVAVEDQCAASSAPVCSVLVAGCIDPDFTVNNTPAELCACGNGLDGNEFYCGFGSSNSALLAEVQKAPGEASAAAVVEHLKNGASPNVADDNGVAALIVAARQGHAEIVSVLVTAGADVNATDPTFHNSDVVQHLTTPLTDPAAGPRTLRARILRHFLAALDVRNTLFGDANFNWNYENVHSNRALGILASAEDQKPRRAGENAVILYEMADSLIARGAECNHKTNKTRRMCLGSASFGLLKAVRDVKTPAVEVRAAAQAAADAGVNLDDIDDGEGHILALAADSGHAAAVSILLTFGADPDGRLAGANGRGVLHIVGRNSDATAPLQLRILRHFIGGLGAAGKAGSFNGWNAVAETLGRPLDALQTHGAGVQDNLTAKREIQALLYERGARCASRGSKTYCQIPEETLPVAVPAATGGALTVRARDFGGASFDLRLPDADTRATLTMRGWKMESLFAPRRVVLSRTRGRQTGDDLPTVIVTMVSGADAARHIKLVPLSGLPSLFVTVVGGGSVAIWAGGELLESGSVPADVNIRIAATPDSAYHVSGWSGPCATAPKGADGGERECELFALDRENNRVTVTFSPGRLAEHVPLTGNLPDGVASFEGTTELTHFCRLFGGYTDTAGDFRVFCRMFGPNNHPNHLCDTPGTYYGYYNRDNCGSTFFRHIRDCNVQNKRAADKWNCAAQACDASAGLVARGINCVSAGDQCAASPAPACGANAVCRDPDVTVADDPVSELCVCNAGFRGDGLTCESATASAALLAETRKPRGAASAAAVAGHLNNAADPDIADLNGVSALLWAARNGHTEIIGMLVAAGANLTATDPSSNEYDAVQHAASPLSDPAAGPRALRASVLYAFGAAVNARNNLLGDADFDWDREDMNGRRALDLLALAAEPGNLALEGEDADIINQMADYLLLRGATCGAATPDKTGRVCAGDPQAKSTRASLFAELAKQPPGAASVATVRLLLDKRGAHPDLQNADDEPLLILAARNGHAQIVSVLVAAGANVNATDPTFNNRDVAQHAASPLDDPAAGTRAVRTRVLQHFGVALDARDDAVFNWNRTDSEGNRALDILALATAADKITLAGEDEGAVYRMADYMLARGAKCERTANKKRQRACYGNVGQALLVAAADSRTSAEQVSVAAQAARDSGVSPNDIANSDSAIGQHGDLLAVAAVSRHAEAVSVLLVFGADPNARLDNNGRRILHIVGRSSGDAPSLMLQVLRHFIGGLEAAGKAQTFDGWNAGSDIGRPLDALQAYGAGEGDRPTKREIQALLYERGASCLSAGSKTFCQIPEETRRVVGDLSRADAVLTVSAGDRDFGGTVFDLQLPDADTRATLQRRGWGLERLDGPPVEVVLSRTRPEAAVGDDLPALAVTMVNNGRAVRRINLASAVNSPRLYVEVVGAGSVQIRAGGRALESGNIPTAFDIEIVATPDSDAYHVSEWSELCDSAPTGADGGERTCAFEYNPYGDVPLFGAGLTGKALTLYNLLDGDDPNDGSVYSNAIREYQQAVMDRYNSVPYPDYLGNVADFEDNTRDHGGAFGVFFRRAQEAGFTGGVPQGSGPHYGETELVLAQITLLSFANRVVVTFRPGRLGPYVPLTGNVPDGAALFQGTGMSAFDYFCGQFDGRVSETSGVSVCQLYNRENNANNACLRGGSSLAGYSRCGSANFFNRVRDCNARNEKSGDRLSCGVACAAAAGEVARGRTCARRTDQCAALPALTCHAAASCDDPDPYAVNSPLELCTCNPGAEGDGLTCRSDLAGNGLLDEVNKLPGAADVSVAVDFLNAGADPDIADGGGVAALLLAARNGHAEIISVLVTAGADVTMTDPTSSDRDVVQLLAAPLDDSGAIPRARQAAGLYHFDAALSVRNALKGDAIFDWNRADGDGNRALDILLLAENVSPPPAGENVTIIYQMADYLRSKGSDADFCAATFSRICGKCAPTMGVFDGFCGVCPPGASVVDEFCACDIAGSFVEDGVCRATSQEAALAAEVREASPNLATIQALLDGGVSPDIFGDSAGAPLLYSAATLLHADVVSVLLRARANPRANFGGTGGKTLSLPEFLVGQISGKKLPVNRKFGEVFIRFGDVAGAEFDWYQPRPAPGSHIGGALLRALMNYHTANKNDANAAAERPILGALGGYVQDRLGESYTSFNTVTLIGTSRRDCSAEASGKIYSCSACADAPLLARGGDLAAGEGNCVAACAANEVLGAADWPEDSQCQTCPVGQGVLDGACAVCPSGRLLQDGQCVIDSAIAAAANATLAAEIRKASPSLSTVRAALDAGASPDHVVDGRPALMAAGRRGHAKVVSVLVTAGANVNALDDSWSFGHRTAQRTSTHGFLSLPHTAPRAELLPVRAVRASLLYHFGDAIDARNAMFGDANANYDWNFTRGNPPQSMLDELADSAYWTGQGDADSFTTLQEMADYAILRGAICARGVAHHAGRGVASICNGSAEVKRLLAQAALAAEVEQSAGAANVATVRALLSGANAASPNIEDSAGRPLLIAAARNGHAEIVSVLVTAGADVNATDPTYFNYNAVQHAAAPLTSPAAGPRALRASVLYHFGGGLDVRGAKFDWNWTDEFNNRALDLLAQAEDRTLPPALRDQEDDNIIREMADYMYARRARCGEKTADHSRPVCLSSIAVVEYGEFPPDQSGGTVTASIPFGETVLRGATVTFTAAPAAGWYAEGWNRGACANAGEAASPGVEIECALTSDVDLFVTVTFAAARAVVYGGSVSASLAADGGRNLASGDTVADGATVAFLATPSETRELARWTNHGVTVCVGENPCLLAATADVDMLAEFASLLRTIVYTEDPDDRRGGTLSASIPSGGTTLRGATVSFTATPAAGGWYVADWSAVGCANTGSAENPGVEHSCVVTVGAGLNLTVFFANEDVNPVADMTLAAEIVKRSPNLAVVREALVARANANLEVGGAPALIVAATLGHAEIVSVLVTAGADAGATDPTFHDLDVVQHAATPLTDPAAGPRALRASVLYYFGGALEVVNANFDWNRLDANQHRALDILALAEDKNPRPDGEDAEIIYQMADYMLAKGAQCGGGQTDTSRRICHGPDVTVEYAAVPGDKSGGTLTASVPSGVTTLHGTTVTFNAAPATGWAVSAWEGDAAGICAAPNGRCALALNGNKRVTVIFSRVRAPVAFAATPETGGRVTVQLPGADHTFVGWDVTFTAIPAEGWHLAGWTGDGTGCSGVKCVITGATAGGVRVTARFVEGLTCPVGQVFLAGQAFPNGACVACPAGQAVFEGSCVVTDDILADSGAGVFLQHLNSAARDPANNASLIPILSAMYNAAGFKFQGRHDFYSGVSKYETGGASYNAEGYALIIERANLSDLSGGPFSADNDREFARILAAVPSAGSPEVGYCSRAGWTPLLDGGDGGIGGCGVPLTVSGGTADNRCHFSGSASPQCADVFGATMNYFPAPALSEAGATLRFVYNCDPGESKGIVPATINTVGATECSCTAAGMEVFDGACVPVCEDDEVRVEGVCVPACAATETRTGGVCVAGAVVDACESAGWPLLAEEGGCGILVTLAGGTADDQCYFTGSAAPQCADVFGSTLHYFPAPTLAADGATLRFVYNCDPSGESGLLPATANTVEATECACAAGMESVDGACVDAEIAAGARNCLSAGRDFSAEAGGSCAVAVTLADGAASQRCYLSGESAPQCADVFGAAPDFPDQSVSGPFIYNCDPDGVTGLIPARVNTTEATACVCAVASQSFRDGVCQCPVGQGVRSDGTCGTCPGNEGFLPDGTCGDCPSGQQVVGGFCLSGAARSACENANWSFSADGGGSCGVLLTLAGGRTSDRCHLSGGLKPQCADVFGSTLHYFPAPTLAADGATTLRFVYDCDPDGDRGGMIPATANTIMATECGCASETSHPRPGACVPEEGASPDFEGIAEEALCGAFGGTALAADGGGRVCSGMDKNDTFCILDSSEVFPCRGLFKHLRICNIEHNRPALNPFFCGKMCEDPEKPRAVGSECRR